jgi:pentatricopeptide repeat protein
MKVIIFTARSIYSPTDFVFFVFQIGLYKKSRAERPPLRVFNTVVNACEVCGEEELTVRVLDAMKETHNTEGNLITFNIALKRLAKQGNTMACEGIVVGMLQGGIEPSVVSYTTAIAACVHDPKKPDISVEWIKRMKSRLVQPNVITYNTAFASCLDGTVEGTKKASELATFMIADVRNQVESGIIAENDYTNVIPNFYTRTLAKSVMQQLEDQIKSGDIDEDDESDIRESVLELVDYLKSDLAELADKQKNFVKDELESEEPSVDENTIVETEDEELEYSVAISTHRAAMV